MNKPKFSLPDSDCPYCKKKGIVKKVLPSTFTRKNAKFTNWYNGGYSCFECGLQAPIKIWVGITKKRIRK